MEERAGERRVVGCLRPFPTPASRGEEETAPSKTSCTPAPKIFTNTSPKDRRDTLRKPWRFQRSGTVVPPVRIVQPTHGRDARATTAENQTRGIQRYTRTLPQDEGEACRALRNLILPGAAPPDVHLRRRLLFSDIPRA